MWNTPLQTLRGRCVEKRAVVASARAATLFARLRLVLSWVFEIELLLKLAMCFEIGDTQRRASGEAQKLAMGPPPRRVRCAGARRARTRRKRRTTAPRTGVPPLEGRSGGSASPACRTPHLAASSDPPDAAPGPEQC